MSMFTLSISCLTISNTLIHGPNILGSCAILFFTASDFTSITSYIHNCMLYLVCLYVFILSGVISPLFSSSILGTYWPGEFIFQFLMFSFPSLSFMANRLGKNIETDFISLASKITADGDCSHEIKRHLLLERKAITNLDSILKSRDINLSTKVHLVKAMVFPVVMYGCESWT